jgi:mannose-6-phosphate isomerase-like protein (cupin superfamily)
MDPIVLRPGEGEKLDIAGNELVFKARPEETGGAYVLTDYTAGPGFPGPPPHRHREMTDAFFVLEGTLTLSLGEETIEAPPGSFVLVPPGTAHTFSNPRDEPVRFLNLNSPPGFEQYFRDLAEALSGGALDPAVVAEIAQKYDIESA